MRSMISASLCLCCLFSDSASGQGLPDIRLTQDPAFSATTFGNARSLAVSGDTVHVVWFDVRDGNRELYYKRSSDGGLGFGLDTRLTNNTGDSHFPSVAASQAFVHVVWEEMRDGNPEIYYKRSTNDGVSFAADVRLTNNAASSFSPSLAVSGSDVHVVWFDNRDGNSEIYYKRSTNGGSTFGPDTRLTNQAAASLFPSVAVAGSVVNVVWEEYRDGANGEIYSKRSPDIGANWGVDTRLTLNSARSLSPSVAASGSLVHVVWFDLRDGNSEIYDKRSTDGGLSFGADVRLTQDAATSEYPCVLVSGSNVHVTWMDERDGNTEIYSDRSLDGGVTWTADARLTNDAARSTDPSIAAVGPVLHVIWTDARDAGVPYNGNYEIYYERDPLGNVQNIGTAFCIGDGAPPSAPCPCGNNGALGHGCANAMFATGAFLSANGNAGTSVGTDTLVLSASNIPGPALFFQSSGLSTAQSFGDGQLCASLSVARLGVVFPIGNTASYPGGLTPNPIHTAGAPIAAGETKHYQSWYRSVPGLCSASNFNLTQGLSITWGP